MASAHFRLEKTLTGHIDTVNTLSFSPDTRFLASGGDDGLIRIFGTTRYKEVRRFRTSASITAIIWNARFPNTLIAGDRCGDIHIIRFFNSYATIYSQDHKVWLNHVAGPIHCFALKDVDLAVGFGNCVALVKHGAPAAWHTVRTLPQPPTFPELNTSLPRPTARSLQFLPNDNVLIVAYLDHGIVAWNVSTLGLLWQIRPRGCKIGASSLSPSARSIAVTNLYDGVDWYSLKTSRFSSGGKFVNTVPVPSRENILAPICHSPDGAFVIAGGSAGAVRLIHAESVETMQILEHGDAEIVQAVVSCQQHVMGSCCCVRGRTHIATGVSERGSETVVRIWIEPSETASDRANSYRAWVRSQTSFRSFDFMINYR
ncbi:WD40 repeat-like protein [Dentipellis sp. KUC8613]|nr:WD40 repeat-like protein [Dentipellis sp. KUC8613]